MDSGEVNILKDEFVGRLQELSLNPSKNFSFKEVPLEELDLKNVSLENLQALANKKLKNCKKKDEFKLDDVEEDTEKLKEIERILQEENEKKMSFIHAYLNASNNHNKENSKDVRHKRRKTKKQHKKQKTSKDSKKISETSPKKKQLSSFFYLSGMREQNDQRGPQKSHRSLCSSEVESILKTRCSHLDLFESNRQLLECSEHISNKVDSMLDYLYSERDVEGCNNNNIFECSSPFPLEHLQEQEQDLNNSNGYQYPLVLIYFTLQFILLFLKFKLVFYITPLFRF